MLFRLQSEVGPSQLLISLTPEKQPALMFLGCSGHLLYGLMIILTIKGKIKAEQSSFLVWEHLKLGWMVLLVASF